MRRKLYHLAGMKARGPDAGNSNAERDGVRRDGAGRERPTGFSGRASKLATSQALLLAISEPRGKDAERHDPGPSCPFAAQATKPSGRTKRAVRSEFSLSFVVMTVEATAPACAKHGDPSIIDKVKQ